MDYNKIDLRQSHTNMYQSNLPFHQSCPPQNYTTLSENNKDQFKNLPSKQSSKNSLNALSVPAPISASNLSHKMFNPSIMVLRSPRTPPGFPELELKPQFPAFLTTTSTCDIFPFKSHPRAADEDTDEIHSDDYENPYDFLKKLYEKYKIK
jgi:hypothetical protein